MKRIFLFILFLLLIQINLLFGSTNNGFTQEDRERLIKLETALKVFMEQVDKRFEQVDKRISELREDMNKRFELIDKRFEQIDKRFEQIDKRFEQVDKRFEQMMNFLWMLVTIFTTLTGVVIGFAYWDRRTIIRKAKEETIEEIEKEGRLKDLIKVLKELAVNDKKLANTLKQFGLM